LVVGGAPPLLRARPEHAPQIAAGRRRPGGAVAERALEVAPEVLDLAPLHLAGLLSVDLLDHVAGLVDGAGERPDGAAALVVARGRPPELELELPRGTMQRAPVEPSDDTPT